MTALLYASCQSQSPGGEVEVVRGRETLNGAVVPLESGKLGWLKGRADHCN